jgi:hypothetical protein
MWRQTTDPTWTDLIKPDYPYTETQAEAAESLIVGQSYSFKVRARNIYGFGSFS